MNASTPLIRVVTEAMILGVYRTEAVPEFKLILFLSRRQDGSWTVGGRFPSVEDELLPRIDMPYRTFRRAVQRLIGLGIVTSQRLGHSYTYALSQRFVKACHDCCDNWDDHTWSSGMITSGSRDDHTWSSPYRAQEERANSATADAARPDGRAEEGHLVSDFEPSFYEAPTKRTTRWGGEAEGTPLGGEDSFVIGKVVKRSPPRSKAVLAVKEYFQTKLLPFSEARHVPLWESVGKMHNNIKFLVDTQGHSQDILERAIDFFASQAPSMMFQGTSLWDQFFAHREDYLKFAAVAGIGTHGGPRESMDDLAKRLSQRQQEQRNK